MIFTDSALHKLFCKLGTKIFARFKSLNIALSIQTNRSQADVHTLDNHKENFIYKCVQNIYQNLTFSRQIWSPALWKQFERVREFANFSFLCICAWYTYRWRYIVFAVNFWDRQKTGAPKYLDSILRSSITAMLAEAYDYWVI